MEKVITIISIFITAIVVLTMPAWGGLLPTVITGAALIVLAILATLAAILAKPKGNE
jgi:hypothetical protein